MKLSIITINYNNALGLADTIKSVMSQTYVDYEFIIIDGASTDNSIEVIKFFYEKINYFISEPDNGIYNAMNKGIAVSKGEYCFFLNSGDYIADNKVLETVFKNNPNEDVLFGNLYITRNSKIVEKAFGKDILSFSDVYNHTIKHQASFVKRNMFEKFGSYDEKRKIISDWEFYIKTVGLGNASYKYLNIFISYFDNNGISNKNPEISAKERIDVIKETIPSMMQKDYDFLHEYKRYQKLYENKFSYLIIRILNKIIN